MQKIFVFLFFLISPVLLFGQKKGSIIKIINSTRVTGDTKKKALYLINPVFQQDNATLTCDSAVFYTERNYFEAYKNVHIQQLTTDIYSDELQYDGNKKHAHLTGNVKMVDPKSTLTTNILDYDMVAKIGTYTSGGKIETQDVTLTSKNGYYFNNSSDAYFRYNVLVVTPQSTIKSDTMRYNVDTKWTYFYGPTNIKGKDDNMYTENGAYNTLTEDAYFGKKNLYTQDTKSLKGDSLYYYGKAGYGKAVKNIVFTDKKDGTKMFGDLGYYYKIDQRTLVTKNAYVDIISGDSVTVKDKKRPDTLRLGADTLETQMVLQKTLKLVPKISVKADNQVGEDEDEGGTTEKPEKEEKIPSEPKIATKPETKNNKNSKNKRGDKNVPAKPDLLKQIIADSTKLKTDSLADKLIKTDSLKSVASKLKPDSTIKSATKLKDSLQAKKALANVAAKKAVNTTANGLANKNAVVKNLKDATSKVLKPDSAINPADTIQTRTIKAYHNVKIFKSNIQAKTDSLFYTSADSTLRCFVNPIVWSEGSQMVGDTIYVQFKNNKLNNLQAFRNSFLVNTPADSLRFNQIKGRFMTGFFSEGKLKTLYVDGNAESIYYTQDDSTKVYKEMNQTLSSRIKFTFKENDIDDITYINNVEAAINPENKIPKDNVLKGFSWKPKERPRSKKEAIGSSGKPKTKIKAPAAKPSATKKSTLPQTKVMQTDKNISKAVAPKTSAKTDSLLNEIKPILPKKDSTLNKLKIAPKQ
ncbi:OstA-like protein [Pedobacter aquatilis]|uniref:OstA-like protein n=1 Tax=Pedobacter aquatilis TaxID=351343 RepID=UPI0025B6124E|nr:OstA-like protein [Pedobacter aquatilis]MDN3586945.1 OstA-like protein [Pedobacter aquatilis]